jgi:hypothetical protein
VPYDNSWLKYEAFSHLPERQSNMVPSQAWAKVRKTYLKNKLKAKGLGVYLK